MAKAQNKQIYNIQDIKYYLIKRFHFSEESTMWILNSSGIKSADLINDKLNKIIKFLGTDNETLADYLKRNPKLLNISYELLERKCDFYRNRYGISKSEFCKMALKSFTTLASSTETAIAKEEFCLKFYGFTLPQYIKAIKTIPSMIGTSEETHKKSYNKEKR